MCLFVLSIFLFKIILKKNFFLYSPIFLRKIFHLSICLGLTYELHAVGVKLQAVSVTEEVMSEFMFSLLPMYPHKTLTIISNVWDKY